MEKRIINNKKVVVVTLYAFDHLQRVQPISILEIK